MASAYAENEILTNSTIWIPVLAPAPTGNAVTDTANILATIQAAQAAGRQALLAPAPQTAPYLINPGVISLTGLSGIKLSGWSKGLTWMQINPAASSDGVIINFTNCTDIDVSDINYDGQRSTFTATGVGVITVTACVRFRAHDLFGQNLATPSGTAGDALVQIVDSVDSGAEHIYTNYAGYAAVIGSHGSATPTSGCYARHIRHRNTDFNGVFFSGNIGTHATTNTLWGYEVDDVFGYNMGDTNVEVGQGCVLARASNIYADGGGRGLTNLLIRDNVGTVATNIVARNMGTNGTQANVKVLPLFTNIVDCQVSNATCEGGAYNVYAAGFDGLTLNKIVSNGSINQDIYIGQGNALTMGTITARSSTGTGVQIGDDSLNAGTLSVTLATGAPITGLPVNALANEVFPGTIVLSQAGNTQSWTTTGAAAGATSIPVTSQTPNFAYTSAASILTGNVTNVDMSHITTANHTAQGVLVQGFTTGIYGSLDTPDGFTFTANTTLAPASLPALAEGVTQAANFTATPNTLYPISGTCTAYLPTNAKVGSTVAFYRTSTGATLTIQTASGTGTVNGQTAAKINGTSTTSDPLIWLLCVAPSTWIILSNVGNDAALGFRVDGILSAAGQFGFFAQFVGHINPITAAGVYSATNKDWQVRCSGSCTGVLLPTSNVGTGQEIRIVNKISGSLPITTASGTVDVTSIPTNCAAIYTYNGTGWDCNARSGF